MSVTFEVQKKVFAAVTAAVAGHSSAPAVHDHAPENAPYPFVELSRHIATAENLLSRRSTRHQVVLTVYSTAGGQREVLEIMDLIYPALDDADLTIPGADFVRCDCERRDTARDQDGRTYTGSMIFAIYYEH